MADVYFRMMHPPIGLATYSGPLLDVPVGLAFLFMSILYTAMLFVGVTVIETIALWVLKWAPLWRSFLDSVLINLVSSAAGLGLALSLPSVVLMSGYAAFATAPSLWALLLVTTVAIEIGMLRLLHKRALRKIASVAVMINLASYLTLVGLLVLDGQGGAIIEEPTVDLVGFNQDLVISGAHLYLLDGSDGVQILDVSGAGVPRPIARIGAEEWGWGEGLAVNDQGLFIAERPVSVIGGSGTEGGGLRILDISVPEAAAELGYTPVPESAVDLEITADYAYVCDAVSGLFVVDVSVPKSPEIVNFLAFSGGAKAITANRDVAFVATASEGIAMLGLSDPASPARVGRVDAPGGVRALQLVDTILYVASEEGKLSLIDVANPILPRLGTYAAEGDINDVAVAGTTAYVAVGGVRSSYGTDPVSGVVILDVSRPTILFPLGVYRPTRQGGNVWSFYPLHVVGSGAMAYVVDAHNGLWVVDTSRPDEPRLVPSD
jgi:hypothetical protein